MLMASARSEHDVRELVSRRAADAINIKLMKSGVAGSLAMIEAAKAGGLRLMIGGMVESILAMTFSAQMAAGSGGFSWVDLDTPMFIANNPFKGGFTQDGERLSVAHIDRGCGVEIT
jgi:L-Ala-D/L-Glu epimerase